MTDIVSSGGKMHEVGFRRMSLDSINRAQGTLTRIGRWTGRQTNSEKQIDIETDRWIAC